MFKSSAAVHRQTYPHLVYASEGMGKPIDISWNPPQQRPAVPAQVQDPDRIPVFVRSITMSSDPEAGHANPTSSACETWRDGGAIHEQQNGSRIRGILRRRPTGLRPTKSYPPHDDPSNHSLARIDSMEEGIKMLMNERRRSSTNSLLGGPMFEIVQSDDGLFEVGWEAMPPNADFQSQSSISDTASDISSPESASLVKPIVPQENLPYSTNAREEEDLRSMMRSRNDSLTAPDILVHTTSNEDAHPRLHFADSEPSSEPSLLARQVQLNSPPSTSHATHPRDPECSPPTISIFNRDISPATAGQPPTLIKPSLPAKSLLSTNTALINPLLRRQLSNLAEEEKHFKNHRDSVALCRLRMGFAESRAGPGPWWRKLSPVGERDGSNDDRVTREHEGEDRPAACAGPRGLERLRSPSRLGLEGGKAKSRPESGRKSNSEG